MEAPSISEMQAQGFSGIRLISIQAPNFRDGLLLKNQMGHPFAEDGCLATPGAPIKGWVDDSNAGPAWGKEALP